MPIPDFIQKSIHRETTLIFKEQLLPLRTSTVLRAILGLHQGKRHLQAKKLSRKLSPPKMSKNRPPDHIWG